MSPATLLAGLLIACGGEPELERSAFEPAREPAIYGGEPSATCAWPATAYLDGCTGTLIHPELVVLAAHCVGLAPSEAMFGDDYTEPRIRAGVSECRAHPQAEEPGNDVAFCRLSEPITGIPIVPLMAGCETGVLAPGIEVVAVGFGAADDALGAGPKRQVRMPIVSLGEHEAVIGGNGKDTCTGDSGGPVAVALPDGTWRIFGVTSYGGACGSGGHYALLPPVIDWLERESGLDLTPCLDGGNWTPTSRCGRFPLRPDTGSGAWSERCATTDVSGWSASCGAPHDPAATEQREPEPHGGCALSRSATRSGLGVVVALMMLWLARGRAFRGSSGN